MSDSQLKLKTGLREECHRTVPCERVLWSPLVLCCPALDFPAVSS